MCKLVTTKLYLVKIKNSYVDINFKYYKLLDYYELLYSKLDKRKKNKPTINY